MADSIDLMSGRLSGDFEILPLKGVSEQIVHLPPGSTVTVTASPAKGLDATMDLAIELKRLGHRAVPHFSARLTKDRETLAGYVRRIEDEGIDRIFVIGGDGDPAGPYSDALTLLKELADIGHKYVDVGIGAYPDGHSVIPDEVLHQALLDKQQYATYLATQMCFDPGLIVRWLRGIRDDGVTLPVKLGVPGVVDPIRLLTVATRIGVGDSTRFLAKNKSVLKMLRPGPYKPDKLIGKVLTQAGDLGIDGLHLFTFNQIESTARWYLAQRS